MGIYIATRQGLILAERRDSSWHIVRRSLEEQSFTSVAAAGDIVLAGTRQVIGMNG